MSSFAAEDSRDHDCESLDDIVRPRIQDGEDPTDLGDKLASAAGHSSGASDGIDAMAWVTASYEPTPNIIQAAVRLYEGHSVRELSHGYAHNLDRTTEKLERLLDSLSFGSLREVLANSTQPRVVV